MKLWLGQKQWLLHTVAALKMARGMVSISWSSLFLHTALGVLLTQVFWQRFPTGSGSNIFAMMCLSTGRSQLLLPPTATQNSTSFLFWCRP